MVKHRVPVNSFAGWAGSGDRASVLGPNYDRPDRTMYSSRRGLNNNALSTEELPVTALRVLLGIVAGFGIAFGSLYLTLHFAFNASNSAALLMALIGGLIAGVYSAVAFGRGIYSADPLSILGYVLDMSWSLLNTAASLLGLVAGLHDCRWKLPGTG